MKGELTIKVMFSGDLQKPVRVKANGVNVVDFSSWSEAITWIRDHGTMTIEDALVEAQKM